MFHIILIWSGTGATIPRWKKSEVFLVTITYRIYYYLSFEIGEELLSLLTFVVVNYHSTIQYRILL